MGFRICENLFTWYGHDKNMRWLLTIPSKCVFTYVETDLFLGMDTQKQMDAQESVHTK